MFKEITNLRKSWKLEEAYNLAIQEYSKNKDDLYIKGAYSWVLYEYIKNNVLNYNFKNIDKFLNEFSLLSIEPSWEININELVWKQIYNLIKNEENINNYKKLLYYYSKLNYNWDLNKFIIIDVLTRYKKDENFKNNFDIFEFINLFWISKISNSIFHEKSILENWKEMPSIFERILSIVWEKIKNSKNIDWIWNINILKEILSIWVKEKYKWAKYYEWKLFIIEWKYNDALVNIKDVVKKEESQFWSWSLLWEILLKLDKRDLYFSALSKALLNWRDDDFLNNVRYDYIQELDNRWFWKEANIELNKILKNKMKNSLKVSDEIDLLKSKNWFHEWVHWDNKDFYIKNIEAVENFLFEDIPNTLICVKYINEDKKIINFIDKNRKKGFFKYWSFDIIWLKIWDIIYAKIENVDNEYYKFFNLYKNNKLNFSDIFSFENVVINNINHNKKILNFSWNYKSWFFNYSWFEDIVEKMKKWDFLYVIFDENNWDYYKIYDLKEDNNLLKDFSWMIKRPKKWSFWFVDNIFINEDLMRWIGLYDKITWIAKKVYNKKDRMISWSCIEIK